MKKQVETFDAHQKLAVEALERANKENIALKQQVGELDSRISRLTEEVETIRKEIESAYSYVEEWYIANFHFMEAYQSFVKYRQRYAYTEMVEQIEVHSQTFNTFELRSEFLEKGEEEPQTLIEGNQLIKIADESHEEVTEVENTEVAHDAIVPFVLSSFVLFRDRAFLIFFLIFLVNSLKPTLVIFQLLSTFIKFFYV